MLDPQVLLSRTFVTAACSAFLSLFGFTAVTAYYPLFVQGVQGVGATLSGQIMTPFSVLLAFMGVPAGLLLSRTRRYKWMYIGGYAILVMALLGLAAFTNRTPIVWGFAVTALAGLGLGTIPTLNTLVAQYALPRRLLGAATGGIFFFVMLGRAISPALLGSVLNSVYTRSLGALMPALPSGRIDEVTLASIGNPRVLLSAPAMAELEGAFAGLEDQRPALFQQVVEAIRASMGSALKVVFLLGALTMLVSFLLVLTIPEIAMDPDAPDRKPTAVVAR
jgi:MFS family permease